VEEMKEVEEAEEVEDIKIRTIIIEEDSIKIITTPEEEA
jgi:hypothetical protein